MKSDDDSDLTRRSLLKAGLALAGAALLHPGLAQQAWSGNGKPANKEAKYAALYQDTPKGPQACAGCHYFVMGKNGQGACQLVAGEISPAGWCNLFAPKQYG